MTFDTGEDPELIPEFVPTEQRFHVTAVTEELRKVISRVSSVSKDSGIIEGSDLIKITSVLASKNTSGYIEIKSTDGENFFSSKFFRVRVKTSDEVLVPAKKLSEILKLADGQLTTISCVGFALSVTSGNSRWTVSLPSRGQMRSMPEEDFQETEVEAGKLQVALMKVIKASATGFARASMQQLKVGQGTFLASDGHRLHRTQTTELETLPEFCIPYLTAKYFITLLGVHSPEDAAVIGISPSSVRLSVGEDTISCLKTSLPFPDVEKAFVSQSVLNDSAVIVSTKELKDAVRAVKIFATDALTSISMSVIKDAQDNYKLLVSSEDEIGNASRSVVGCTMTGKNLINLRLSYKHVADVLESVMSDMVSIRVGKNTKTTRTTAFFEDIDNDFTAVLSQTVKE